MELLDAFYKEELRFLNVSEEKTAVIIKAFFVPTSVPIYILIISHGLSMSRFDSSVLWLFYLFRPIPVQHSGDTRSLFSE